MSEPDFQLTVEEDVTAVEVSEVTQDITVTQETTSVVVTEEHFTVESVEEVIDVLAVAEQGPEGPQGPKGDTGDVGGTGPVAFAANHAVASVWSFNHNLGYHPSYVYVEDSAGTPMRGVVKRVDDNNLTITFIAPFGGRAWMS